MDKEDLYSARSVAIDIISIQCGFLASCVDNGFSITKLAGNNAPLNPFANATLVVGFVTLRRMIFASVDAFLSTVHSPLLCVFILVLDDLLKALFEWDVVRAPSPTCFWRSGLDGTIPCGRKEIGVCASQRPSDN